MLCPCTSPPEAGRLRGQGPLHRSRRVRSVPSSRPRGSSGRIAPRRAARPVFPSWARLVTLSSRAASGAKARVRPTQPTPVASPSPVCRIAESATCQTAGCRLGGVTAGSEGGKPETGDRCRYASARGCGSCDASVHASHLGSSCLDCAAVARPPITLRDREAKPLRLASHGVDSEPNGKRRWPSSPIADTQRPPRDLHRFAEASQPRTGRRSGSTPDPSSNASCRCSERPETPTPTSRSAPGRSRRPRSRGRRPARRSAHPRRPARRAWSSGSESRSPRSAASS